jgi:hypothetical protein
MCHAVPIFLPGGIFCGLPRISEGSLWCFMSVSGLFYISMWLHNEDIFFHFWLRACLLADVTKPPTHSECNFEVRIRVCSWGGAWWNKFEWVICAWFLWCITPWRTDAYSCICFSFWYCVMASEDFFWNYRLMISTQINMLRTGWLRLFHTMILMRLSRQPATKWVAFAVT